ncbi:methyltransferase domain-containing protein [Thermodesulfovibrio hydrogeniphilus]
MIVAKAKSNLNFDFNGYHFKLKPGDKLLFANDVFGLLPEKIKAQFEQAMSVLPPFYNGEDLNGKTLLIIAQAAIGDALCMTPALREIKRRYPDMSLHVTISGRARKVLEKLPYIDKLLPIPVEFKEVSKADYIVKVVEMVNTPQFDNLNMVEYFLWKFHLYNAEKETPDIVVDEDVLKEMKEKFDKIREASGGKKVLLFHYLASSIHRTLPPKLLKKIEDLIWDKYVPIICSLPDEDITVETALDVYGIKAANFSVFMKDLRYLIASVALSDAVITADTATLHISAGLGKPTVAVFGPIDAALRCSTYQTVIGVAPNYRGQTCVSPCKRHFTDSPCIEAQLKAQFYSPCIESIPAEVIYHALIDAERLLESDYPKPEKCILCEFSGHIPLFEVINGFRIFECSSCGLQFTYPMKVADYEKIYKGDFEDLLSITDLAYKSFQDVKGEKEEIEKWKRVPRFTVLIPILKLLPRGRHLDVGAATGFFMLIMRNLGYETYGMEASESAVKIGQEKFNLNIAHAVTFQELPDYMKKPYNIITAFEVLEHVHEPLNFLQEIFNLLEEGGILLLSCPPFYKFENISHGYRKFKWWFNDYPPHHVTRWKLWTLYYALKKVGFSEIHLFTEPLIPGTVLEGVNPPAVDLKMPDGKVFTIDANASRAIVLETLKPLYLNSPYLGNFQYALAVKGSLGVDIESMIKRAIRMSAVEIIWSRGDVR